MRSSRILLAAFTVLGLTVAGTSCSSSDDTPHGIATASCTETGRTVQFIDPDNGKVLDTRHFKFEKGQTTLLNCMSFGLPGYAQRSALSKDFGTLAVSKSYQGGAHLGTLKATDDPKKASAYTDLSGDDLGTTTQSNGAFGPDDMLYAFEQSNGVPTVKKFDPDNGKSEPAKVSLPASTTDDEGNTDANQLYFLPRSKSPEASSRVHKVNSPEGTSGFAAPDDAHLQRFKDGKVRTYRMPYDPKVKQGGSDGNTTDPVAPVVYIDDKHCLSVSQGGESLYYTTFDLNEASLQVINLKGLKGGTIQDVTPYTDDKAFAFIYRTGQQRTLYSADLNGKSVTIKKLRTLSTAPDARITVLSWS